MNWNWPAQAQGTGIGQHGQGEWHWRKAFMKCGERDEIRDIEISILTTTRLICLPPSPTLPQSQSLHLVAVSISATSTAEHAYSSFFNKPSPELESLPQAYTPPQQSPRQA